MSTTRTALFTLAALGLAAFAAHPVFAQSTVTGTTTGQNTITGTITGLFDTGVSSSNVVLANGTVGDPHYTLTAVPTGDTITQTLVRTGTDFPLNYYIPDSSTSAWIGPDSTTYGPDLSGPPGLYSYTTTFNVMGLAPGFAGSAVIKGNWATDDIANDILINGVSTGQSNTNGFSSYTPFTINATNLKAGLNTLTFDVYNVPGPKDNPTALRVDGITASGVTASAAPEPSQIGMLALAALGLGALAVKARRRTTAAQTA